MPCPEITIAESVGGCASGLREVTLTARFVFPPEITEADAYWWVDGVKASSTLPVKPSMPLPPLSKSFAAGTSHVVRVVVDSTVPPQPQGGTCPGAELTIDNLPPCPPCPRVTDLIATVDGCAGAGKLASVAFTGTLAPAATGCKFYWTFGDPAIAGGGTAVTDTPAASWSYSTPGSFSVAVASVCAGDCIVNTSLTVVKKSQEPHRLAEICVGRLA